MCARTASEQQLLGPVALGDGEEMPIVALADGLAVVAGQRLCVLERPESRAVMGGENSTGARG